MGKPQKITDVAGLPVVGKTYMVPCASNEESPRFYSPVIGVPHNDSKYGFGEFCHLHYDFRFLPEDEMKHVRERAEKDASSCSYAEPSVFLWVVDATESTKIWWTEMKCLRQMPTNPLETCGFMVRALEPHFKDQKIDPKRPVCPHRQVCLKGLPHDDGVLVCPAHGLRWDAKTGEMLESKLEPWMSCSRTAPARPGC